MTISEQRDQERLILQVKGRLDTVTSPQLEQALKKPLEEERELVLDFSALEYISSAGLRVLLTTHKKMEGQKGRLVVRGANAVVLEVFNVTGFTDILHIQRPL